MLTMSRPQTKTLASPQGPVWAEIDLGAIAHNLRAIRKHIGARPRILAVVKADAYGHGAVAVARALARAGADCFGVTCTEEGRELRESGIRQPVLVLTGFWPGEESRLLTNGLTPSITDIEQLKYLDRAAAKILRKASRSSKNGSRRGVEFHLKIDTGMNRLGVPPQDLPRFLGTLADCRHLRLAGTFTHFSAAEDFSCQTTERPQKIFGAALSELRAAGVDPGVVHMANSAGIAARPDTWCSMVRPGALLYGYHQFYEPPQRKQEMERQMPLRPALSLRARVISVKEVPAGQAVGYNARFVTARPSRIAVLAAGYAEGIVRILTNRGRIVIGGRCAPLVGTISMDLAMADVTELNGVAPGQIATVFGRDPSGGCALYASDVAHELGTVTSDVLCAIGRRVRRVYL